MADRQNLKSETGHGTQKPVEWMRRPIENNASPGQAVYEPFSGSGTTIIAAEMTDRVCHAIEIAPAYVDVAVKRWQEFTGQQVSDYIGLTGPTSFGIGRFTQASSGTGELVGVSATTPPPGMRILVVPAGYISGTALSEDSTWNNQTFGDLGVTPGTYVWTWGSGSTADSFTLIIGAAAVPEPSSLLLLGVGLGVLLLVGKGRCRLPKFSN